METVPLNGIVTPTATVIKKNQKNHNDDVFRNDNTEKDTLFVILSAAYAKLLVAMGIAYPLAEAISHDIRDSFYVGFYLYLYLVSIAFLIYAYAFLLGKDKNFLHNLRTIKCRLFCKSDLKVDEEKAQDPEAMRQHKKLHAMKNCGSFYLRVGAIAFGIGSMIYSGLEFVQFFVGDSTNSNCFAEIDAIKPCLHMAFTFIQLYFIFLNSKMCIHKYQTVARFGLMHMVATNLCVWLLVVIQESKHEIQLLTEHAHAKERMKKLKELNATAYVNLTNYNTFDDEEQYLHFTTHDEEFHCHPQNVLGQLVQKASPFLFPCTIEYSLICAAICYIMWKNIGMGQDRLKRSNPFSSNLLRARHHYSVDCTHTMRGLFTGILVLVASIISVILFFVLINREQYHTLAVLEAHVSELVLFSLTTIAVVIAMAQIRHLPYHPQRNVELDSILLIVAQLGVYLFSIFSIISGHLITGHGTVATLVILTAFSRFFQATCQTVFILDASQRTSSSPEHAQKKPGREMITLLLVCNFAMWIIKTMKTGRPESNPVQQDFYGLWGWTIISRVSTPLAIFFRFHSTVCLCEIWKKLYKLKKPNSSSSSNPSITD